MKIQIRLSNRRFVLLLLLGIWDYCKMIFLVRFQLLVSCWGRVPVLRSDLRKLLQWKDTKTGIPVFTINLVFIVQNICQEMNNNNTVLNIFCSQNVPNWDFVHMDTWNRTFNCNLFRWDLEYFLRSYIRFFFVHWKFSKKISKNSHAFHPSELFLSNWWLDLCKSIFQQIDIGLLWSYISVKMNIVLENNDELLMFFKFKMVQFLLFYAY